MILLMLFLATVSAFGICLQRGIVSDNAAGSQAVAAGLGAGFGVTWRFLLGLEGSGFIVYSLFIAGGILLMFGGYRYGRRIRRLRAEAAHAPETFE
jgi:hypothetical protein